MELSLCHTNTPNNFCSPIPTHKTKNPPSILTQRPVPRKNQGPISISISINRSLEQKKPAVVVGCGDTAGCTAAESEIERELEAEMRPEWFGEGRLREKCGDRGVVELLECLEREAIMGEDEGKEPNDYNRRAQIFYNSSRLFQALKDRSQS